MKAEGRAVEQGGMGALSCKTLTHDTTAPMLAAGALRVLSLRDWYEGACWMEVTTLCPLG